MADDRPSRRELRPGMTVRIEQDAENNPGEPLVGEVRRIISAENRVPGGVEVELRSGATGHVKDVVADR